MTDKLIVLVTCDNSAQAETIAQTLVDERLAACVNVLPGVRSCYEWKSQRTWSSEVLLLIKTSSVRYAAVEERVRSLHSYETPEVVALPIDRGFEDYLRWIG